MNKGFKSGFVGIIGRPNVGKSTLLNQILGQKIAIMSDKAQTTRNKIQGIYTTDDMQAVLLDTPGVHKPQHKLGEYMSKATASIIGDVDIIYYIVDATAEPGAGEIYIADQLKSAKCPIFLLVNKTDVLPAEQVLAAIAKYSRLLNFAEVVPIAAISGDNVEKLLELTKQYLPEGPQYYDAEDVTDQPERQIVAEIIREKILLLTKDEVPHSVAVAVTDVLERDNDMIYVAAQIYVERDSQKGIIIGRAGAMLKQIGSLARPEIETLFDSKVYLEMHVKVKKDWRNDRNQLNSLGYNPKEL